jgi:hypothetical protein
MDATGKQLETAFVACLTTRNPRFIQRSFKLVF